MVNEVQPCYRHPGIRTALQCGECGRAICGNCAQQTPVSFKCSQCIAERTPAMLKVSKLDLALVAGTALAVAAALGAGLIGFVWLAQMITGINALIYAQAVFGASMVLAIYGATFPIRWVFSSKLTIRRRPLVMVAAIIIYVVAALIGTYVFNFRSELFLSWVPLMGMALGLFVSLANVRR